MENPSNGERCNRAGIEDSMLLTMFDASEVNDANQEAIDESTLHTPLSKKFLFGSSSHFSHDSPLPSPPPIKLVFLGYLDFWVIGKIKT